MPEAQQPTAAELYEKWEPRHKQKPPLGPRLMHYFGLDKETPISGMENLRDVTSAVRSGLSRLTSIES